MPEMCLNQKIYQKISQLYLNSKIKQTLVIITIQFPNDDWNNDDQLLPDMLDWQKASSQHHRKT